MIYYFLHVVDGSSGREVLSAKELETNLSRQEKLARAGTTAHGCRARINGEL